MRRVRDLLGRLQAASRSWLAQFGEPQADDEPPDDESIPDDQGVDDIPDPQRAYVLNWGRFGPPQGGTYHENPECWTLRRSDSTRRVVSLPRPLEELEADEDWSACGHCAGTRVVESAESSEDSRGDSQVAETEKPVARMALLDGHSADEVESFEDLATPDWLDEASFYQAVDMSEDVGELQEVLGWDDQARVETLVEVLDLEEEIRPTESLAVDGGSGEVDTS